MLIDGVKNFEITDNDLYSAWLVRTVIIVCSPAVELNAVLVVFRISIGNGHFSTNATYGLIARNTLYSGNAAHWFNQVHQVNYLALIAWTYLSSSSRGITPARF